LARRNPAIEEFQVSELWSNALQRLSAKVAAQNFEMWLRPIEFSRVDGETLVLRAPNPYVRLWFESNYLEVVIGELKALTEKHFTIEFEPDSTTIEALLPRPTVEEVEAPAPTPASQPPASAEVPVAPMAAAGRGLSASVSAVAGNESISATLSGSGRPTNVNITLNPRYSFDTFVAGPSSASTYPPKYNPVFLCGGVGLGKTHLLHAIGHQIRETRPGARLLYLSGERFMNEYIHAIRTNRMHDFRRRYRESCDALLVDDVQFLAGKDGTQDEFFHTFNALHDAHRQIVLTADRQPHEISDIADRLRTRFAWGLMADIEPPELEVRVAILRKKAEAERIHLPDDVALYIASSIKSNVRELEGALIRLAAYSSLSRREITMEFARETLQGSLARPQELISVDRILKAVANYYGLKVGDLKSPRRHKSIAGPRAVAMYLARTHTNESYPDLGRSFGGKHHTTVISAFEKIAKRLKSDPTLRGEVHAIEGVLLR
jgi:chromosomal replication initiator protein